ncbi:MAG TPA: hypothetical protein VF718_01145 [Allosphingosinicella sp.]
MSEQISLEDWNWATLMATQAMIGLVSPNFRHVVLRYGEDGWRLTATLRADDPEDRLAVEEIVEQFLSYMADVRDRISPAADKDMTGLIVVSQEEVAPYTDAGVRILFKMREHSLADDDDDDAD